METLTRFARHAAIAIANARRYERERRRTERLALIARIGSIITADLRLEDLLQNAADAIHELLGYPNVAIPLIDPNEPRTLVLRFFGGQYKKFMEGEYRLPISSGIMGAAARERTPLLVNDVAADGRYLPTPGAEGITAELAVPILLGERVLGVLNVESNQPFDDEDVASLRIIADQLAVAVQNARLWAETRRTLDNTSLLYQTLRRIGAARGDDVDGVIAAYLEQVAAGKRYACSVALYEHDAAGQRCAVIVQGSWTPNGDGILLGAQRFPHSYDDLDALLDAGQTVTIPNVHTDARVSASLRKIQKRSGRPALALIPLMVRGGARIGLVVLSHSTVHDWPDEALQPYQATAVHLATAIDGRLQQSLSSERGQRLAVLEERQRLARELHDSVTQLIFSMTLIAQTLGPAWQRDPSEGERRAQRLLELSRSALAEMRDLLQELRPAAEPGILTIGHVRENGLTAALSALAANASQDGQTVMLDADGYEPRPLEQEEALFRITQEALSNAAKHARARHVRVRLRTADGAVRLTIEDDGVGFAPDVARESSAAGGGGMGLSTMRERAQALNGTAIITSAPQQGTRIEVMVPTNGNKGNAP